MRYAGYLAIMLLLLASPAQAGDKVSQFVGQARTEAKRWQKDAVLVEINVTASADGTIDPKATGRQGQQSATFTFYSPATGQAFSVMVLGGKTYPMPGAVGSRVPIPEKFLELSEAVAQARKSGLREPLVSAQLRAHENVAGQPNRMGWLIMGRDPATGSQSSTLIDAVSGAATTIAKLSGQEELEKQREAETKQRDAALAKKIPDWVPIYPGSHPRRVEFNGPDVIFLFSASNVEGVLRFYEQEMRKRGFSVRRYRVQSSASDPGIEGLSATAKERDGGEKNLNMGPVGDCKAQAKSIGEGWGKINCPEPEGGGVEMSVIARKGPWPKLQPGVPVLPPYQCPLPPCQIIYK